MSTDLPYGMLLVGLTVLLLLGGVIYFFVERKRGRERLNVGRPEQAPPPPPSQLAPPPRTPAPRTQAPPAPRTQAPQAPPAPRTQALPRPGDATLLFPNTPPATLNALLDRVTAANAADLDGEGRPGAPHVIAHDYLRRDLLPGGGTTLDTSHIGGETTLYLLLQLRALDPAAVADAEAWITLRYGDLHMATGDERYGDAVERAYEQYDSFGTVVAEAGALDDLSAAIARELLPYAPPLGTKFYGYIPPERPADALSVDLVSESGEAYLLQYSDDTRERFGRVDEARRPYRTPREAQLAAEERIHGHALSAGARDGDAVPDHVAAVSTRTQATLAEEKAEIPTAEQLSAAVAAGDGVVAVRLSAKHVERHLAEGDIILQRLLETEEVIYLSSLSDGRTALTVDRAYGMSMVGLLVTVLRPHVADDREGALQAWTTAQGFDHFTSQAVLVAGTPYYLHADPGDAAAVLATNPAGETYRIPTMETETAKPIPVRVTETYAYVPPPAEVSALQLANPSISVDGPAADAKPHIPNVVAPPGDRVIVVRDTTVPAVRSALEVCFGELPAELRPELAPRADGATVLTFPDAMPLDQLCVILDGLAAELSLGARDVAGHATFTTADGRMAIDPMRMMSSAMDFHANWLVDAAGDGAVEEAKLEALTRFANAQLTHGGPREGMRVYVYPVADSIPEDPIIGLTDESGQGYRYYAQRLGRQLRRVGAGDEVRAYEVG